MRPPALERLGFYPTANQVAELLKTYFKPADSGRLLDPCAGEGTAAAILAKALNCQSWGAELSPARAALAAEKMDRLFNTPWGSCHLTSESITLLFLNPPYSHDRLGDQKRLELEFLKSTTPKLVRGGVLLYIVPHPLLRDLDVASHLAGYYDNIRIYRYPESGFNQVIVLATKRVKYKIPSHEEIHQVQSWADVEPPVLVEVNEPLYTLLPASDKGSGGQPVRFSRLDWQPEEIVDATQKRGLHSSKEWLDLLNPSRGLGELKQPVMPLKKGHIAMLMASGMMGTLRLTDEDGKPMLVKGRVVKVTEKVEENTDKKGNVTSEIFRDRFVSTVAILRQSGIEIIDTVEPLSKFMHKYGDQIGAHILSTYRPLYNFDPTPEETAILDTLGTKRKPLPGQEKAGLLPAQRHAVIAMARSIRKHAVGNLQGEMGLGKANRVTSRIYTPDGYKLMGEIQVGDKVINPDGGYANVIGVFPQGVMDIYRVTFSDGSSTEVTEDHLWAVNSPLRKWRGRPLQVKSLREIMSNSLVHLTTGNYQVFIPMVKPVQFVKRALPIHPYLLGVLLGDGGLSKGTVKLTSADQEILEQVKKYLPSPVLLKSDGSKYGWRLSTGRKNVQNPLLDQLRILGLAEHTSPEKFIPEDYLYSDVEDRLALLQGLMDTDGSVNGEVKVEYSTTSPLLAKNVKELVQSLGGTVRLRSRITFYTHKGEKRTGRTSYRLYIKLPSNIMPFRLSRKANAYHPAGKYEPHRSIVKIEHVGQDYAQCIMLDSENQLYVTDEYIVTHNTTIGSGVVELLDAYPAVVLCPPHLVPKWIREIEETIPGAKAMELTRIGHNADDPGDVNDVRYFLQRYKSGELGQKPIAVIAHTSAKYGAGWEHAVVRRRFVDEGNGQVIEALCCPTCGSPIQIDLPGGFVKIANTLDDLGDKRRFCDSEISGYELDEHKRLKLGEHGNPVWGKRICRTPLFQFTGRRWAIADYIAKHARDQFKMLVADECLVRGTMIETSEGAKPIQDIQVGDYVLSFNHATNRTEYRQVLRNMKNPAPDKLIKVAGIVCTPNHPIFTKEEDYAEAQKVSGKKVFVLQKNIYDVRKRKINNKILFKIMRLSGSRSGNRQASSRKAAQAISRESLSSMWQGFLSSIKRANNSRSKVLLLPLQCTVPVSRPQSCSNVRGKNATWRKCLEGQEEPIYRRANAHKQSNERPFDQRACNNETKGKNLYLPWWKWEIDKTTSHALSGSRFARECNGACNTYYQSKRALSIFTSSIQSGYRYPGGKDCYRSRWQYTQNQKVEISGPPQNGGLEFSRVERVEILERGSGSGFGEVCPDGFVYNFEVEGNNNYFANGVLVHNCHQFKSKSSDRGIAFHQLVTATKYTLTLTGTFFGGKSTSIFWLLHRLNAGVRKDFAFNDEKRWARLYGVLEMTRKSKRSEEDGDEDGFTGNRRYQNQAKEQPGISPAIVNRLLDTTVFLSLKDLGLALPHYAEEVVTLEMTEEQSSQYRVMAKKLYDLAIKNRRYLSTWLQWTLARPNSAFRDEVVEVDEVNLKGEVIRRKELMELPAVVDGEAMPKESWLVDFCRAERQQGRKVLIYLRQTGTRDIQDRILKVLRDGGVRAEVLTSGVNPRKREEWIAKRVVGLDALVVNPRLVETGLDLVAFSSVVFAEIEYSLYTLWQAVRRVWRLGQTKPVKAIFSVYSEAMEARALALMGQKMKAAQLLYGDEVGGAIIEQDEGDILMKLAREALESADLPDLQSLFADEVAVSNSPMGCPTVPSAPLPVPEMPKTVSWSDWITNKGVVGRTAGRARPKQTTQNQVTLF